MDIKEYIASGLIEAYILGGLSAKESAQVEADIAANPELAVIVAETEATMQQYAASFAKQPPPNLENKIWNTIQERKTSKRNTNTGSSETEILPKTKHIPFEPEYRKPVQWKYAATIVALIGSVGVNILLWNETKQFASEKTALTDQINQVRAEQQKIASELEDYQKGKNMMADTAMQTIVMHTAVAGHPMAATIYWRKTDGAAYVAMNALPAPPKGMQYQLWAIKGGKPVDMGTLPNSMANSPTIQKIAMAITSSEAFAISLEKEGGNPTPTLVYVLGKTT